MIGSRRDKTRKSKDGHALAESFRDVVMDIPLEGLWQPAGAPAGPAPVSQLVVSVGNNGQQMSQQYAYCRRMSKAPIE